MKKALILLFFLNFILLSAQSDSIDIHFSYEGFSPIVNVQQRFDVMPNSSSNEFFLYAWANAYKDKNTTLAKTKLGNRQDELHFAPISERGWIEDLRFLDENNKRIPYTYVDNEIIKLIVPKGQERLKFKANYSIHLPHAKITNYGLKEEGSLLLKYFFLQPGVKRDDHIIIQHYKDFESLSGNHTHYELHTKIPDNFEVYTDLKEIRPHYFVGDKLDFFQLAVVSSEIVETISTAHGDVIFGLDMDSADMAKLKPIITEELAFLKNTLGGLKEPLFISKKSYARHKFDGVQDIDIPLIGKYQIFDTNTRLNLEMIAQLTSAYADKNIIVDMRNDHWIRNGIKAYLQMKYIEQKYPDLLLSGKVSDDIRLFNFRPLKMFEVSKLKMTERSRIFYQMFLTENLDQAINTPFDELSNLNQKNVSYFKTGLAFENFSTYLGEDNFHFILQKIIEEHCCTPITAESFENYFKTYSDKDVSWFFDSFIPNAKNLDFAIKNAKTKGDSTLIKIRNQTELDLPFRISAYENGVKTYDTWMLSKDKITSLSIPNNNYDLIVLNDSISFPDFNPRNNYYRPKNLFRRKLKFGLVTDYPSYEYNQIFLFPDIGWNNYDKLQLGVSISNKTILPQIWTYKIKPQYSTGESTLTGNFSTNYNIYPNQGWFRKIKLHAGLGYRHYNKGLSYKTYSLGTNFTFNKSPRSLRNRSIVTNFQHIDRDLALDASPEDIELKEYKLYNLGYQYWNPGIIHEKKAFVNFQLSNKFSKIYGEFYWRWKFSKNKRLGVRVFGGSFINHSLENSNYFDFGLDRITDYTFSYPLLGRSETSGLLSQQFVLAEGGFKSNFFVQANQYLYAMNLEYPLWKIFDLYGDMGVYKNKLQPTKFVYDSGLRVRVIPDFLEIYLPIQSSLGFEPTLGAYHDRIRFMLNLDLGKVIEYWQRGKY